MNLAGTQWSGLLYRFLEPDNNEPSRGAVGLALCACDGAGGSAAECSGGARRHGLAAHGVDHGACSRDRRAGEPHDARVGGMGCTELAKSALGTLESSERAYPVANLAAHDGGLRAFCDCVQGTSVERAQRPVSTKTDEAGTSMRAPVARICSSM